MALATPVPAEGSTEAVDDSLVGSALPAAEAELLTPVLTSFLRRHPGDDTSLIVRAAETATVAHAGQLRRSGEPYVTHPIAVAGIVADLGLDAQTVELIQRWRVRRERIGLSDDGQLFCTLAGDELKAAYVRELLPRLARRAGIDKRVHPLGLRYACAAEMSAEGMSTALIEAHLGVATSGSARRYLVQYTPEEVVSAVRARAWRL